MVLTRQIHYHHNRILSLTVVFCALLRRQGYCFGAGYKDISHLCCHSVTILIIHKVKQDM